MNERKRCHWYNKPHMLKFNFKTRNSKIPRRFFQKLRYGTPSKISQERLDSIDIDMASIGSVLTLTLNIGDEFAILRARRKMFSNRINCNYLIMNINY